MADLLPCPFCGGQAVIGWFSNAYAQCTNQDCNAVGPIGGSTVEGVAMWNARASSMRPIERAVEMTAGILRRSAEDVAESLNEQFSEGKKP